MSEEQLAAVRERDLQDSVVALAAWMGVLAYHTHDSRRSQPGFPDLVLCGLHGVLFRELKTARGRATRTQALWGAMLREAGQNWDLWRPADLASGRVKSELEAIR